MQVTAYLSLCQFGYPSSLVCRPSPLHPQQPVVEREKNWNALHFEASQAMSKALSARKTTVVNVETGLSAIDKTVAPKWAHICGVADEQGFKSRNVFRRVRWPFWSIGCRVNYIIKKYCEPNDCCRFTEDLRRKKRMVVPAERRNKPGMLFANMDFDSLIHWNGFDVDGPICEAIRFVLAQPPYSAWQKIAKATQITPSSLVITCRISHGSSVRLWRLAITTTYIAGPCIIDRSLEHLGRGLRSGKTIMTLGTVKSKSTKLVQQLWWSWR